MTIDTKDMDFARLNRQIREGGQDCHLKNCIGQRFIAAGVSGKKLTIDGVPGNALGAYLNGAEITGGYPPFLKERIFSKKGHLSNEDCAEQLKWLIQQGLSELNCHKRQHRRRRRLCHARRKNIHKGKRRIPRRNSHEGL